MISETAIGVVLIFCLLCLGFVYAIIKALYKVTEQMADMVKQITHMIDVSVAVKHHPDVSVDVKPK